MDGSSEFAVIPALDLKGGAVVHARQGNRADYRPVASPFGAADDAAALARGLLAVTNSPVLYVADLDAIAGDGNHFELLRGLADALPATTLWIDAGVSNIGECAFWLPLGATLVIGSESLAAAEDWRAIHGALGETVVLSLDFDASGQKGPAALFDAPSLWPERIVVMSLARVGSETGPDLARLQSIVASADGRAVYAAGGVRDIRDLEKLVSAGARGAILATALHGQAVTPKEIAALLRERRP
jgi:HisA/HisF family protein